MLVLVEESNIYPDFGEYIINLSLGGKCEVKLDEMNEQLCSLRGQ